MRQQQYAKKSLTYNSTTIALGVIVVLFLLFSCKEETRTAALSTAEADSIAFMSSYGVSTLISDSGRISYKVEAEEWHMYEKRNPPYWAFEKGIYLEKYDDSLRVETTLRSDTAYYYDKLGLWQLFGNVRITTAKGEKIFTHKLFWSSDSGRIYSDSYIKIEQRDQVTEGIGFSSNQDMSVWEILNTTGIYPIEE
ncbi:MAG: LPS export ABC transporter periplasmic protein LptC [Bacteroidaceae bacterium]|nr:LPS export ABC transporter periplasmic protein LptC [Bacteroidaceae bacterium]MBR5892930.1 LPS export ABC transporter periplasmic protein LptC [Bacteroidaceae bacterium]